MKTDLVREVEFPKLGQGHAEVDTQGATMAQDHLLDVSKVAEILSCSERTVWRWRDDKVMPEAITIGRVVRWSYRALMAWIGAGCPKGSKTEGSM
jgi:predicted DNA-binding transcriptional regulator AlpA